jgi:hypothetical protein
VAFIGDMNATNVQEQIGYVGEAIVLEMTALGLGTCWVGGFFRKEVAASAVNLTESERVIAVTPIGYAKQLVTFGEKAITGFGRSHRRKRLSVLTTGLHSLEWPQWIRTSLQAARLAPSAVNRQPWRFKVEHESITVSDGTKGPDFNVSKRLDCGIAMLHIEVAAANCGVTGEWQFLESPSVARFSNIKTSK